MDNAPKIDNPLGRIMQIAYTVPDLPIAIGEWAKILGVGPFFVAEHFQAFDQRYYGEPCNVDTSIALSYSGSLMIALIQQHDDSLSVFRDQIAKSGYGFHHWAKMTKDFDAEVDRCRQLKIETAFSGRTSAGDARFAYMDTKAALGGILEFIEYNPDVDELFASIRQTAATWDGQDPIRQLG